MVARGCRSMADYNGYLFYVGNEIDEDAVQMRLLSCKGHEFRDGADVLLTLRKLPTRLKNKKDLNQILEKFERNWMKFNGEIIVS